MDQIYETSRKAILGTRTSMKLHHARYCTAVCLGTGKLQVTALVLRIKLNIAVNLCTSSTYNLFYAHKSGQRPQFCFAQAYRTVLLLLIVL